MPSNPYKDQQLAFAATLNLIDRIPSVGMKKNFLIVQILSKHAISRRSLLEFLDECEQGGICNNDKGVLYGVK